MLHLLPIVKKLVKLSQVITPGTSKSPITAKDWHMLVSSTIIYISCSVKIVKRKVLKKILLKCTIVISLLQLDKNQESVFLHNKS